MDGILVIDKPVGMTSHDVVYKVRKATGEKRIGHTGTLDPMASGVLVLCCGTATKLVKYFTEHDKEYVAEIEIGYLTDTLDKEGTITQVIPCPELTEELVDETLKSFLGESEQIPPDYSAIRIEGKRMYEYARKNQEIPKIAPRFVKIHDLKRLTMIDSQKDISRFSFFVRSGKGMYVRSLCRDIGTKLGSVATMSALRRNRVGTFSIEEAHSLAEIQRGTLRVCDPLQALGFPKLVVDSETATKVKNGTFLPCNLFPVWVETTVFDEFAVPLAIYTYDKNLQMMRLSVLL
jgi:tRNA pseudouridine55 synthase